MKKIIPFLCIAVTIAVCSCEKEKEQTDTTELASNKYVNSWINENMSSYYFWNNKIPKSLDNTINPSEYFSSMLYKFNKQTAPDGDRFSWIQENYVDLLESLSGVESNEIGFEYKLYAHNTNEVFGEIAYVKKGTDAASKGLKRGQAFTHVNGTKMTISNYQTLLSTTASIIALKISDPTFNSIGNPIDFTNPQDISINLLSKYSENPVYLDTVYTVSGKNIGYLVYNFFAADAGDESGSYDLALNNVFAKFKNKPITELIVDLRYNSGGSLRSAIYLSSMIVKNLNTSNTFLKVEYNNDYQNYIVGRYGADYLIDKFEDNVSVYDDNNAVKSQTPLNNVNGLQTLYILSGNRTASASEMVINGLKPYMEIFIVGDTTVGKNVGSVSFYEENDQKNKWGMQPIIAKFYNSVNQSDFTSGFVPNILDRDTWNMPKKSLGDIEEALLSKAIGQITGEPSPIQNLQAQSILDIRIKELHSSFDKKAWRDQIVMPANSLAKPLPR